MKLTEEFIEEELPDYEGGFPTWGIIDGGSIDIQVCAESTCEHCGHKGLQVRPFINRERKSYRAFAVCPECGEADEF